jgi:hypothetical protein
MHCTPGLLQQSSVNLLMKYVFPFPLLLFRGSLIENLINSHRCIEKECTFFGKLNREYWEIREREVQGKKTQRAKARAEQKSREERDEEIRHKLSERGVFAMSIHDEGKCGGIACAVGGELHLRLLGEVR